MAILEDSGKHGSPNAIPDHPGKPALQAMFEAEVRCDERRKWRAEHPGNMGPENWDQISADYATIEHGEKLLGCCGARTFEPGDAFISKGGK